MKRSIAVLIAVSLAAVSLTGCGKPGDLERPAPLWGAKAKADFAAQKARDRAAAKARQAQPGEPEALPPEETSAGAPNDGPVAAPAPPSLGQSQAIQGMRPMPGVAPPPDANSAAVP